MQPRGTTREAPGTPYVRNSPMMRRVNTAFARFVDGGAPEAPLAFFCECSSEACYAVVWLTAAGYEARLANEDGWIVVAGHTGSARLEQPAAVPMVQRSPGSREIGRARARPSPA